MPRVDPKITRKALKRVQRLSKALAAEDAPALTEWEAEFLEGIEARLNQYGAAFVDPEKGAEDAALSIRQNVKLKQLTLKSKGEDDRPMPKRRAAMGKGLQRKPFGASKAKNPWGKGPPPASEDITDTLDDD
jgi:hypothetical protein